MLVTILLSCYFVELVCASYINNDVDYFNFDYDHSFHKLNEIEHELDRLSRAHRDVIKLILLGRTTENRDINAVFVSNNKFYGNIVVFECGIHSREWITVSFCLWSINKLIHDRRLLDHYQFLILPVLNPDGYAYSWDVDRLWRQNREYYNSSIVPCFGLDINRNFATREFCSRDVEQIPCGEQFCGPHPFSSAEALALSQYLWSIRHRLLAYFSFHSYSQYWAYPMANSQVDTNFLLYGTVLLMNELYSEADNLSLFRKDRFNYQIILAYNYVDYKDDLSRIATEAIRLVGGTEYKVGPVDKLMYRTSGTSTDWVNQELNVSIVFTIEMPPEWKNNTQGGHWKAGFTLPVIRIKPVCEELWSGIEALLDYLVKPHSNNSSQSSSFNFLSTILFIIKIIFHFK